MGDERQDLASSMSDIVRVLARQLPELGRATRAEYDPNAAAELAIAQKYSPRFLQLQADLMSSPASQKLAQAGRDMSRAEQLGAAETELAIAQGPGKGLAQSATDLQRIVDPEFYAQREALSQNLNKLFSNIDPGKLTGSEMEQISRGLGRAGYDVKSPQSATLGALTFGDALAKRRGEYANYLGLQTGALQPMRTGFTGFEAATRRTLMPNAGLGAYTGIQQPGINAAQGQSANMFGANTALQQQVMGKQMSTWDKVGRAIDMTGSLVGSFSGGGGMSGLRQGFGGR